jgi:hypothetical protein
MSDKLILKHNEKKKLNEWIRVYSLTFSVVISTWEPNLRLSSFTFKRDKVNLVANICMWRFGQISPPKSNLGLILISIKNCANIQKCWYIFNSKFIKPIT